MWSHIINVLVMIMQQKQLRKLPDFLNFAKIQGVPRNMTVVK